MKWQLIPHYYPEETIKIKHYTLLSRFGVRLHFRPEIDCWEFRLAYFTIVHKLKPMLQGRQISIPIPFMKNDHGIGWY